MAKHVLYDAVITVNSVTLTDRTNKVSWVVGTNKQPGAAMSEVQDYSIPGTIFVNDITIEYYQDYAASNVYITHKALWDARSTFTLTMKATSSADSATNPNFTCSVFIVNMPYMDASRGDVHKTTITYAAAAAMTYDTA